MKLRYKLYLIIPISCICYILYYGYIDNKFSRLVQSRFYRSAQLSETKLQELIVLYGIRSIINLRGEQDKESWYQTEKQVVQRNHVALTSILFQSHELPKYLRLNELVNAVVNVEKPVLIHCWRGSDRTGMASALVLAIEKDLSLIELKKQFSWRYGVFPFRKSVGDLVFSTYEQWLKDTGKKHNSQQLLYWIKNIYTDPDSNLEYWIEAADGQPFESSFLSDDLMVSIPQHKDKIVFSGWAFDANSRQQPIDFYLKIGDTLSDKGMFLYQRQDVDKYLGFDPPDLGSLKLGWIAEIHSLSIPKGCHQISLTFVRKPNQDIRIPARNKVCIE